MSKEIQEEAAAAASAALKGDNTLTGGFTQNEEEIPTPDQGEEILGPESSTTSTKKKSNWDFGSDTPRRAFTPKELQHLQKWFERLDSNNSGSLSFEELQKYLSTHESNLSEEEIKIKFDNEDKDKDGNLSFREFANLLQKIKEIKIDEPKDFEPTKNFKTTFEPKEINFLSKLFNKLDKDNSGLISKDEVRTVFEELETEISEDDLIKKVEEVDKDSDGQISFREFIKLLSYVEGVKMKLDVKINPEKHKKEKEKEDEIKKKKDAQKEKEEKEKEKNEAEKKIPFKSLENDKEKFLQNDNLKLEGAIKNVANKMDTLAKEKEKAEAEKTEKEKAEKEKQEKELENIIKKIK